MRPYDWVTFDCYGTLVDWDRGIGMAIVNAGSAAGVELSLADVMTAYHEIEPVVQAEAYRSYREVLQISAARVAKRLGWPLAPEESGFLPGSIGRWPPFDDTGPALERLISAGYRLGILSNVDRGLLAQTVAHLPVEFELIVTAEDVHSYKPAHGHFQGARRQIGEARWLHAAQSWFHDVVPACELGVPVAWVNRKAETPGGPATPERELAALADLADWLS